MNKQLAFILVISVLLGAYAAEIYTQYFYGRYGYGQPVHQITSDNRDTRSAIEVVHDMRKTDIEAYPYLFFRGHQIIADKELGQKSIFTHNGIEFAPLGLISNVTTALCNEIGKWQIYKADEHGFNNPQGIWQNQNIDVLALGDSFTHGSCVDPKDHMIGKIRSQYPLTVNLGRLGTGPLFQLATLREYGPALKPKVVVWFVLEDNDIDGDLHDELKIPILRKYLDGNFIQNLLSQQQTIDEKIKGYVNSNFNEWIKRVQQQRQSGGSVSPWVEVGAPAKANPNTPFLGLNWGKISNILKLQNVRNAIGISSVRGRKKKRLEALYGEFEDILVKAQETVNTWGGKIQIVYLAGPTRYNSWRQKDVRDFQRQKLLEVFARQKLPVIDIVSTFAKETDPASLFYGHYSPKGYEIVSDLVLKELAKSLKE